LPKCEYSSQGGHTKCLICRSCLAAQLCFHLCHDLLLCGQLWGPITMSLPVMLQGHVIAHYSTHNCMSVCAQAVLSHLSTGRHNGDAAHLVHTFRGHGLLARHIQAQHTAHTGRGTCKSMMSAEQNTLRHDSCTACGTTLVKLSWTSQGFTQLY
jgi:hypothetical protein